MSGRREMTEGSIASSSSSWQVVLWVWAQMEKATTLDRVAVEARSGVVADSWSGIGCNSKVGDFYSV